MAKQEEVSVVDNTAMVVVEPEQETRSPFILGNTKEIGLTELGDMLTPVFSRDNVETISHTEAISTVMDAVSTFFDGEEINAPVVRVSHEMKLRNRFGMGKLVENLRPEDSDSYYQRMMAMIEIPSISHEINGSVCHLQIGIVRNYADCNLLGNSSQKQTIKMCCGFLNIQCIQICSVVAPMALIWPSKSLTRQTCTNMSSSCSSSTIISSTLTK